MVSATRLSLRSLATKAKVGRPWHDITAGFTTAADQFNWSALPDGPHSARPLHSKPTLMWPQVRSTPTCRRKWLELSRWSPNSRRWVQVYVSDLQWKEELQGRFDLTAQSSTLRLVWALEIMNWILDWILNWMEVRHCWNFSTDLQDSGPIKTTTIMWHAAPSGPANNFQFLFSVLLLQILTWVVFCNLSSSLLSLESWYYYFWYWLRSSLLSIPPYAFAFHWRKAVPSQINIWRAHFRFSWPGMFTICDC